jgi:hypothetical protein
VHGGTKIPINVVFAYFATDTTLIVGLNVGGGGGCCDPTPPLSYFSA